MIDKKLSNSIDLLINKLKEKDLVSIKITNKTNSIGVGFRWFNLKDSLKMSLTQTLLTIFSTNPPIWYATKNRTDFAKIFKYMNQKNKV